MLPTLPSLSLQSMVPDPDLSDLIHPNYKSVNKLIMVGNGFDLAHGIKSSFNHFIHDYVKSALIKFAEKKRYSDQLGFLKLHPGNDYENLVGDLDDSNCLPKFINIHQNYHKPYLLSVIIQETSRKKWVDIEVSFYDFLIKQPSLKSYINSDLEHIRHLLIEYLKKEEATNSNVTIHPDLLKQFQELICKREVLLNTIEEDLSANRYYFVNFNYTSILKKYVEQMPPGSSTLNHIHGALNTEDSSGQEPIFGFGDELDKNYGAFEEQRDDSAFEHIKSFKYLEGENYRNLMEFIEAEPFQVCIFGHSCGVSDRTMLNKIFEHENCISIKVYYYQNGEKNDYTTKNYSIARCFKDKSSFRNKVVNFKYCSPMVQPSQ